MFSNKNMVAYERCLNTLFTPSVPAAIEVSRMVYARLSIHNPSLYKVLLPEYLDYYTTACIWMRMITIKQKNSQPVDKAEMEVLNMIHSVSFYVPKPIMLQLEQLGNVVTTLGQHLYATFPTLPQEQIDGRGGYYGILQPPGSGVDDSLHNLYEEIPCLGVLSEAIMHAISDDESGRHYRSVVTYQSLQPNENLLGFKLLGHREPSAKNLVVQADFTKGSFSEYPANTAMNLNLLIAISSILQNTQGFKVCKVKFSKLSITGCMSQTIISRPLSTENQINLRSAIRTTSVSKDSNGYFGKAIFFCSQLIKDSGPNADHATWCMISPTSELPIPPQLVANRNLRRNLPLHYMEEVFTTTSCNAEVYRLNKVNEFILAKTIR